VIALVAAPVCAFVELVTRRGLDTLTVPLAAAFTIVPLIRLFARVAW